MVLKGLRFGEILSFLPLKKLPHVCAGWVTKTLDFTGKIGPGKIGPHQPGRSQDWGRTEGGKGKEQIGHEPGLINPAGRGRHHCTISIS